MTDQPNSGRNPGSTSPADDQAVPTLSEPEGAPLRVQAAPPAPGRDAARVPLAAVLAWMFAGVVLLAVSVAALLAAGRIGTPVTITVDGYTESLRTTQPDVAGLLTRSGADAAAGRSHCALARDAAHARPGGDDHPRPPRTGGRRWPPAPGLCPGAHRRRGGRERGRAAGRARRAVVGWQAGHARHGVAPACSP